jgi:hypothetical protein
VVDRFKGWPHSGHITLQRGERSRLADHAAEVLCVYGLRTGSSRLFRNLGLSSDDATRAQHVRAEFYVPGYGWIPVDPSDVRRTIALEGISDRDSKLLSLKKILFGVWEMNWIAFNLGTDIVLPGKTFADALPASAAI